MDNCGFYYGRIIESVFIVMFVMRGVILLFQFLYCFYLNICEYCFYQMKEGLR